MVLKIEEVPLNIEKVCFTYVEQHKLCRSEANQLAAKFRSDRTTTPGYQDCLSHQVILNTAHIQLNGLAPQQVRIINIAQCFYANMAIQDLANRGKGFECNPAPLAYLDYSAHFRA